ncbi:hypothetical protein Hypma_012790 [Hypsizygus marmoreus]|uniref:Uncharacterized protein n=1 Tax=Hypsizygus marmoreus TaxID=39966 RepID=A0A369JJY5_HYPMA|nr:hypothetical protein Hypma_012790 [Hypsizygus marmoreus]
MGNINEPTADKTDAPVVSQDPTEKRSSSDQPRSEVAAELPQPSSNGRGFFFDPPPSDFWLAKPVASDIQPLLKTHEDALAASGNTSFPLSESELPETFDISDHKEASGYLLNPFVPHHNMDNDCPMRFSSPAPLGPIHSLQPAPSNDSSVTLEQADPLQEPLIDFVSALSISSDLSKPLPAEQKGLKGKSSKTEEFADADIINLAEQFSRLEPTISAVLSSPVPLFPNVMDSASDRQPTKLLPPRAAFPSTSKEFKTTVPNIPERPSTPVHKHNVQSSTPQLKKGLPDIPPVVTYADATNLAMKFPDLASQILSHPLPTPSKPVPKSNIPANPAVPGLTASIHCPSTPNWAVASDLDGNDDLESPIPPRRPRRDREDEEAAYASSEVNRPPRRRRGRRSDNNVFPLPTAPRGRGSRPNPPRESYGSQPEQSASARLDPPPHIGKEPLLHRFSQSRDEEETFMKQVSSRLPRDVESAPVQTLGGHTLSTNASTREHVMEEVQAPTNEWQPAPAGQSAPMLANEWDLLDSDPWAAELGSKNVEVGQQRDHKMTTAGRDDAIQLPRKRQASPHTEPAAKRQESSVVTEEAPPPSASGRQRNAPQRRGRRSRSSRTKGPDREMEVNQDESHRMVRKQQVVGLNVAARKHLGDDRGSSRRPSSAANSRSDLNNDVIAEISPFDSDLVTSSPPRTVRRPAADLAVETHEQRFHREGGSHASANVQVAAVHEQVPVNSGDMSTPVLRSGDSPLRDLHLRTNNVDPVPHLSPSMSKEVLADLRSLSLSSKSRPVHNFASQENLQIHDTRDESAPVPSPSNEWITFGGQHSIDDWLPPVGPPSTPASVPLKSYVPPHSRNSDMLSSLDSRPEDISISSLKDSSSFVFTTSPSGKIVMKAKEKILPDSILQNLPTTHSRRSLPAQVTMESLAERFGQKSFKESYEAKIVHDIPERDAGSERSVSAQYPRRHTHSTKVFTEYERKRDLSPGRRASSRLARNDWPVSEIPEWRKRA